MKLLPEVFTFERLDTMYMIPKEKQCAFSYELAPHAEHVLANLLVGIVLHNQSHPSPILLRRNAVLNLCCHTITKLNKRVDLKNHLHDAFLGKMFPFLL